MQIAKNKQIITYDKRTKEANGEIVVLCEEGHKTVAYLNIIYPKAFKGYHLHTRRTNRISCLEGEVVIYTKTDTGINVTPLAAVDNEHISIPPGVPTAIENIGMRNATLLFCPTPYFDPLDTGEMIPLTKKEVEESLKRQQLVVEMSDEDDE